MSSQKGNVTRSRPQRHQNTFSFKNDKFDKSVQTKKINAKLHDGVCQRCKEVLEWRVKYSKYKPLSKPKKCVKCLQKTVKDSYHIMCRPCACELEVCAKCGKKEDVVIPFNKEPEKTENVENNLRSSHRRSCRRNENFWVPDITAEIEHDLILLFIFTYLVANLFADIMKRNHNNMENNDLND
ncbi:hypothetical protein E5288_WYG000226 [Bos mutus]|uniref:Uncharacterized protein n=2 Tax=Bos TaxID=9903 RepID=A0A6B0QQS1_9CETA|nr:hypothetical protein [Bos mutus]